MKKAVVKKLSPKQKLALVKLQLAELKTQYKKYYDAGTRTKADIDALLDTMKNDLDSMNEMGEMESLRLQMAMDRLSKMMSTLSNILKKISDTASAITQNIK